MIDMPINMLIPGVPPAGTARYMPTKLPAASGDEQQWQPASLISDGGFVMRRPRPKSEGAGRGGRQQQQQRGGRGRGGNAGRGQPAAGGGGRRGGGVERW